MDARAFKARDRRQTCLGGPYFTAPEIDKVHRWILEGALEN